MFYSVFYKHTRIIMLFAVFFLLTNILTAQTPKKAIKGPLPTASVAPLSKEVKKPPLETLLMVSEFTGATPADILPNLTTEMDNPTTVGQTLEENEAPNATVAVQSETNAAKDDTVKTNLLVADNVTKNNIFQDSTCVDLMFDSVSIVKMTEKYIEIEYSIINKGTADAPIFGSKRANTDNVAVHFYFSGTPRLTRGSLLADGIYLTEGLRETKGMLAPNAVYKNRFKLSLEKKNRFYGVIILQLDTFDTLRHECDETNNIFSIIPKWY